MPLEMRKLYPVNDQGEIGGQLAGS